MTNERNLSLATRLAGRSCHVVNIDALLAGFEEDPVISLRPDSLAYIYYTSGSTGKPKGVMDTHRNVLHNVMRYTNNLRIAPSDRLTLLQSPGFSGAVSSLFGALLNGASSFPFDLRVSHFNEKPAPRKSYRRVAVFPAFPGEAFGEYVAFAIAPPAGGQAHA